MGLGLYLVRTLVEDYHGRTWVEDRVPDDNKQGARFVVLLPLAEHFHFFKPFGLIVQL